METKTKSVLSGTEWASYLRANNFLTLKQLDVYVETYKYTAIYKCGEYYFSFSLKRGYKSKSRLKAQL